MNARTVYVNGRFLTQPVSGVQRYAGEIVARLDDRVGAGGARARYVLLCPRDARHAGLRHIEQREVGRFSGHLWDQIDFARAARQGVALGLAATGPVVLSRQIVVIHDAAVQRHPELFSRNYVRAHRFIDGMLARRAQLGTVSEFSRQELADVLHVPAASIMVAGNGAEHLNVAVDDGAVDRLELRDAPFFLVLGNITPNKNLALAIRAIGSLHPTPARLVAVGRLEPSVFGSGSLPPLGDNVILAGRLSDEEVAGLMRRAKALVFPSLYEGFGIPPLEAMANDCPVLASTAAAVRETCGTAADFFDPTDAEALAALMRHALEDDGTWRARRIAEGRERLRAFSWERSATALAEAAERLAA